jgi:type II secretory ATPase GspE/PulE/Tfp pilus assembly ATPase PilB-like protein
MDPKTILDLLVSTQYITIEDCKLALSSTNNDPAIAIDYLVQNSIITYDIIGQALAESWGVSYFDLNTFIPSKDDVIKIPESVARELRLVYFKDLEDKIQISSDNPVVLQENAKLIIKREEKSGFIGGKKEITEEKDLEQELIKLFQKPIEFGYSLTQDIDRLLLSYKAPLASRFVSIMDKFDTVAPEIVEEIIEEALEERVSDIHFEPQYDKSVRIRFRVDGMLQEVGDVPLSYYENILNLIKVKSQLRTDEHFIPQDGAIRFQKNNFIADVRISILPTVYGEKIVMRVLANSMSQITLETIGLNDRNIKTLRRASQKPFGMVLVTGPTGSGKSTTLYSILKTVNDEGRNITTIEDPVEYKIPGVNHIQVNKETDLSFARGLRSILRQDPNIILVGEIRDDETAQIAINAALTGHLLFSTVHANDGESTLPRLLNMDIDPFLLSTTLQLIVAQRLVRKICPACVYTYTVNRTELEETVGESLERFFPEDKLTLYRGKGCPNCSFTGYKGRSGLYQLIEMSEELRELVLHKPTSDIIAKVSRKQGSLSLFEDGIEKVKIGVTTLDEVMRVAQIPEEYN